MANTGDDKLPDPRDIMNYQTQRIGELMDYSQAITSVCRRQAHDWMTIAEAFKRSMQIALEISDSCALLARVNADRTGDIIETEFGIGETPPEDDDVEDDDVDEEEEPDV